MRTAVVAPPAPRARRDLDILEGVGVPFTERVGAQVGLPPLDLKTVQINLGKKCNLACRHCHVGASPARTEMMSDETVEDCLRLLAHLPAATTLDLTGGAPEMHPRFCDIIEAARRSGHPVIDRCNLTILQEPGYEYLVAFLSGLGVEIVASLPHYARTTTDRQRGRGVFDASITALLRLNEAGYGGRLPLNLVYNPNGFFLSGPEAELEGEFRDILSREFGVHFTRLYAVHNIPINRFLDALVRRGAFEDYMQTLLEAFNPATLDGLMCRHQVSIGYDGSIYDCDFNQMLELESLEVSHVSRWNPDRFLNRRIRFHNHCYGCTAGAGSSCGGALTK